MCDAKIRPFPNPTEVQCEVDGQHDSHAGFVIDYAYPGSRMRLTWHDEDRRTFRGEWQPCDAQCTLPLGHHGRHAP